MKKKILFIVANVCFIFSCINAQTVEWAQSESYASYVTFTNNVIKDNSGNIYMSGQSNSIAFIIKYAQDGSKTWGEYYGGYNSVTSLCADSVGNLYAVIMITRITINGIEYTTNTGNHGGYIFIKYDNNGNVIWLKQMKLSMYLSDKTDNLGNLIATGGFVDTVYLDNGITLFAPPPRRTSFFIAKFNQNGESIWAIQDDGARYSSLKVNRDKELFACDWFNSTTITLGKGINQVIFNRSDGGSYCAKYNNIGELIWAKQLETNLIAPDEFGNAYVFDMDSTNNAAVYLKKFNPVGSLIWKRTHIYINDWYKAQMECGANGDVYLSGGFKNYMTIDDSVINGDLSYRMFLAKIDSAGTLKWITTSSGAGGAGAKDLAVSGNEIFVTGDGGGENTFGSYSVNEPFGGVFTVKITDNEMQPFSTNDLSPSLSTLNVYPNPSSKIITILFSKPNTQQLQLTIKNQLGQVIYNTNAFNISNEYINTIDLSNENRGIYFIEIISDGERSVKKVALQ